MALTTAQIEAKLKAASWMTRDNVAQEIITSASISDLNSIDAKGVFLLTQELDSGITSNLDSAAKSLLRDNSQYDLKDFTLAKAVATVKACSTVASKPAVATLLDVAMVKRLYAAEKKRMSWNEGGSRWIDGDSIGRGQLKQVAFATVIKPEQQGFGGTWAKYSEAYCAAARLAGKQLPTGTLRTQPSLSFTAPSQYATVYFIPELEDFVVAAYLAWNIGRSNKGSRRSLKDAASFGIALYHTKRSVITDAQTASGQTDLWAPVEAELRKTAKGADICDYVKEVLGS